MNNQAVQNEFQEHHFDILRTIVNKSREYPRVSAKTLKKLVMESHPTASKDDLRIASEFFVNHTSKD